MRKAERNAFVVAVFLALSLLGGQAVAAPRPEAQHPHKQAASKQEPQNVNVYRVTYRVSELAKGKTINSRLYTLMARTGKRASARVGSKIPFKMRLLDVGMKIDCLITEHADKLLVQTGIDTNSVADGTSSTSNGFPVMRNLTLRDVTSVALGKPALVGSIDDLYSNHRYVVDVTVIKIM